MFTRRRLLAASGAALSLTALPFMADAAAVAGKDYLLVRPAVPMTGKPVIIHDFFAYTCPHCLTFAPVLEEFVASLPKDGSVKVIPAPVAWNSTYEIFPRTYFAFEALGKLPELHMPFWEWVIKEEHDWKSTEDMSADVTKWVTGHGIGEAAWKRTLAGFSVVAKSRQASALWQSYGVDSTPSVGVAGKYLTAPHLAGTRRRTIDVLRELIELAKQSA